jgi:hypothetical protein
MRHRDAGERVHGDGGAVEERTLVVAHFRRKDEEVLGRRETKLSEATGPCNSEVLELGAERGSALPARLAHTARDHRLHRDAVPESDALNSRSNRDDRAGELVALCGAGIWRRIELHPRSVFVQVTAADAGRAHAQHGFARAGRGVGQFLDPEVAGAVERRCLHGLALYRALRSGSAGGSLSIVQGLLRRDF